ncbi:hypothetical protein [Runella sp. SP2]|uniref:hypothetical protein n=1 Tax=Runella sp. SP2 TaxID=2268026 RepID=UPI000F090D6E|nr:hypothetical protein [Runella sp. SP2]AYQ35578.1 hypothetical protein DTQ70_26940 [Runella sp. SP2]
MKTLAIVSCCFLLMLAGCTPQKVVPITDLIGKKWKAKLVKEGTQVVFSLGGTANVKPSYANFRLDLSDPKQVTFKDIDGRTLVGTWTVSTDNQRLILENLVPKPTGTIGTVEFFITETPTADLLKLERTAESRKTGNSINSYELIPE